MIPNSPRWRSALAGAVLAAAAPAQAGPDAPAADTVKLKNGNLLEGRILAETPQALTIRIGPGQEVEIPKHVIATFARVSAPGPGSREERASWHARNAWFRLKDADGRLAGKLQMLVSGRADGGIQVEQQWSFLDGDKDTRVHRIERVDASLRPRSFHYRETVRARAGGRVLGERVVRGDVRDGKLFLEEIDSNGRSRRSIPFPEGNQFPMIVAEMLRRGEASGARSFSASVYDGMDGVFELRRFDLIDGAPAPAHLAKPGVPARARLIEATIGGRQYREWVSAHGEVLLVEVNGVHLVAEPISERTAADLGAFGKERGTAAWRRFGGLDLWLPRASWRFGRDVLRGKVLELLSGVAGAEVRAFFVGASPDELLLHEAGETFVKRWRLDEGWFEESSRELVEIDARSFLRIDGGGKQADGKLRLGRAWVAEALEGYLVVAAHAPARSWPWLARQVDDVVTGLRQPRPEQVASPER